MEILRSWGLEEQVLSGGADLRLAAAVSATLADRQQQDFSLGIPQPETLAALSPSVTAISPQDHLEPVLLAHLRSLGGAVRFHTALVGLDQHDGGVSVRVRGAAGRRRGADRGPLRRRCRRCRQHGAPRGRHRGAPARLRGRAPRGAVPRCGRGADPGPPLRPAHRHHARVRRLRAFGHAGPVGLRPRVVGGARRAGCPHRRGTPGRDPGGRRHARSRPRGDRRLPLDLRGRRRRADAGRPGLPRRRRRPPDDAARGDRHEHRHRRRAQPRLEARLGGARLGRRGAARQLRGRAAPDRAAQRPELAGGLRRQQARGPGPRLRRGLPGAGRRPPRQPRRPPSRAPSPERGRRMPGWSATGDASPCSTCTATG